VSVSARIFMVMGIMVNVDVAALERDTSVPRLPWLSTSHARPPLPDGIPDRQDRSGRVLIATGCAPWLYPTACSARCMAVWTVFAVP
jgi:hypothetical protein